MEDALDYVAAYTAGNDISSRKLQRDPILAGPVPQWSFSKGFDTWAPLGPALVSKDLIPDPAKLTLRTTIDGEARQQSSLDDLLFSVPYLISYLSTGTTLEKGSVIMTGTPGGKLHLCRRIQSLELTKFGKKASAPVLSHQSSSCLELRWKFT